MSETDETPDVSSLTSGVDARFRTSQISVRTSKNLTVDNTLDLPAGFVMLKIAYEHTGLVC